MTKLIIVGSGILGLSVAEYLTREMFQGIDIKIITNNHKFSGSKAAAANLATKGQMFARDPHFELKLHGKKIYKNWIHNLIKEDNCSLSIDSIFKNGEGIDYFTSINNRDKHYL
ncbi:MAG: NAD(P)-binding protein, partial [Silvanigrellaceae bacterium]|nr:NAD(P)-binding protein [Silvanigrellaceae bacterium]